MTTVDVNEEAIEDRMAPLAFMGLSARKIADDLQLSPATVNRLMRGQRFRRKLEVFGKDARQRALAFVEGALEDLTRKMVKVLHKKLDEDSLQAAGMVAQMMGLMDQQKTENKDTNLTVVLNAPTPTVPNTIEVTNDVTRQYQRLPDVQPDPDYSLPGADSVVIQREDV